jgi:hypothetical protein
LLQRDRDFFLALRRDLCDCSSGFTFLFERALDLKGLLKARDILDKRDGRTILFDRVDFDFDRSPKEIIIFLSTDARVRRPTLSAFRTFTFLAYTFSVSVSILY